MKVYRYLILFQVACQDGNRERKCWVQIGITSWGWGCGQTLTVNGIADTQVPGYYTNVIVLIDWINSTTAMNSS